VLEGSTEHTRHLETPAVPGTARRNFFSLIFPVVPEDVVDLEQAMTIDDKMKGSLDRRSNLLVVLPPPSKSSPKMSVYVTQIPSMIVFVALCVHHPRYD
jgi:hypothetical protein